MPNHLAYLLPICALDVVVIDDNPSMQYILKTILNAFGVKRIRLFDDGESALREMTASPPNMVVTDWHMRPINGYQLIREMRREGKKSLNLVPVIMLTGYARRNLVEECIEAGVQQFLSKPVSPKSLLERIQWVIKDRRELVLRDGYYNYSESALQFSQEQIWEKARAGIMMAEHFAENNSESPVAKPAGHDDNYMVPEKATHNDPGEIDVWEL